MSDASAAATATAPEIERLSFEEALGQLEQIVRKLESGQAELEQSIDDYTLGTALKNHCQKKLEDARLKVEKLVTQADGSLATEPFDTEN